MTDTPALEVRDLYKRYGTHVAVEGVSLTVAPGEVFGFLGPNGAGKTTTMRVVAGLLRPTSGRVRIGAVDALADPVAAKRVVGYVPDRPFLYEKLTALEFMRFAAGLYGLSPADAVRRAGELLEVFSLAERAGDRIERYSHGMKQRLAFAAALVHRPRLLIVDEPMVGLDPKGARLVKELLRRIARDWGTAVFLSTHAIEVAEKICDRVAIIDRARIVAEGTVAALRARGAAEHGSGAGLAAGSAAGTRSLEEIFMEVTGAADLEGALEALRS
jgi:ABC-2 type transport system ATP-binding protein